MLTTLGSSACEHLGYFFDIVVALITLSNGAWLLPGYGSWVKVRGKLMRYSLYISGKSSVVGPLARRVLPLRLRRSCTTTYWLSRLPGCGRSLPRSNRTTTGCSSVCCWCLAPSPARPQEGGLIVLRHCSTQAAPRGQCALCSRGGCLCRSTLADRLRGECCGGVALRSAPAPCGPCVQLARDRPIEDYSIHPFLCDALPRSVSSFGRCCALSKRAWCWRVVPVVMSATNGFCCATRGAALFHQTTRRARPVWA